MIHVETHKEKHTALIQVNFMVYWIQGTGFRVAAFYVSVRASVSEAATSRLLEVEEALLDSQSNAVVALQGVASHVVSVCPGPGLLNQG